MELPALKLGESEIYLENVLLFEMVCHKEKKLSFRTSEVMYREIRDPEIPDNFKDFWIPARAPIYGARPRKGGRP